MVKPRFSEAELVMIRAVAAQCGGVFAAGWGGWRWRRVGRGWWRRRRFHRPQVRIVRECWWQVRRRRCWLARQTNGRRGVAAVGGSVRTLVGGQLLVDQLTADDEVVVRLAVFRRLMRAAVGRRARGSEPRIKVDVDVTDAEWSELAASAQGADLSVPAW